MLKESIMMRAFRFTMEQEGGATYTNDPRDPGGPTKYGVTLNFDRGSIPDKDADGDIDFRDVQLLSEADALVIYREDYWIPGRCDAMPDALALAHADSMYNLGCGAAPELIAVFRALAVPGGKILAIAPYFPEYAPFVEESGLEFGVVPAQEPDFQIDMEALEALVTKNTQAVIVNSPNNPSGVVYSRETLQKLGALLEEKSREYGHPIYIVSDEPYRELVYDGTEVPFVPAIYRDTIICYSYSKSLSLPGERIGYIYVPQKATDGAALYAAVAGAARSIGHVCAPSLFQKVIARCAQIPPDLASYDRNRRTLYEALVEAGYQVAKPQGAFYLFVKAPEGDGEAFSQRAKEKDLLIVPGKDFGCPGYCRLCYCVPYEKILKSIPIFRELIGKEN